ncbi:MAG: HAMP domain-containing protein [Candidatus Omnitrophica bacterium]|nr:HAMP domain-containing protein [Candidatus Omnitrophota bacterium]
MLNPIRASLGAKFIFFLGIVLVGVFSLITFLNFAAQKEILLNRGLKEANDLGCLILTGIRFPMLEGDQDIIQMQFDDFRKLSGIKSISLLDHNGTIKRSTDWDMLEKRAISPLVADALLGKESHGIENRRVENQEIFTEAIPIPNENQCIVCHGTKYKILGVLNISLDWQPVLTAINSAKNLSIMIAMIGMIIISISVVFLLLQIIIRPIFIVEQGLKRVSEGDLNYKLPTTRGDEIGRVSRMFNQMTIDISNSLRREKELRYAEQLKSKEITESLSLITATIESTADGILVVNDKGLITRYNRNFLDIWKIPEEILKIGGDSTFWAESFKQVENPEQVKASVEKAYSQPDSTSFDIIKFKNGKIIECASKPQKIGTLTVGRVWSFRDVTEQKLTEEALKNKMSELEHFNHFVVGREIKMKELKEEIRDLKQAASKSKTVE